MHTVTDSFVVETSPELGKFVLPMWQVSLATTTTDERIVLLAGTIQEFFLAGAGRLGKGHHLVVLRVAERWAHRRWWLLGTVQTRWWPSTLTRPHR